MYLWIFLSQKQAESEELVCIKNIPLAQSTKTSSPAKGRLRSGASTRSLTSFPSQETLAKLEASSPEKTPGHSVLLGLPGYRPVTRSSLRLQRTSSSSLGVYGQGRHLDCWLGGSALPWGSQVLPGSPLTLPCFGFRPEHHEAGHVPG